MELGKFLIFLSQLYFTSPRCPQIDEYEICNKTGKGSYKYYCYISKNSGFMVRKTHNSEIAIQFDNSRQSYYDISVPQEEIDNQEMSSNASCMIQEHQVLNQIVQNLKLLKIHSLSIKGLQTDPDIYDPDNLIFSSMSVTKMSNLHDLELIGMGLRHLPLDTFWETTNLLYLNLSHNSLTNLPKDIFGRTRVLEILSLAFNNLQTLPNEIFINNTRLVYLDLSNNQLTDISENTLFGLARLKELNLERNNLKTIHILALNSVPNLQIARFSHNELTFNQTGLRDMFGNLSPFYNLENLIELYLGNNRITEIFSDWTIRFAQLHVLDLSYNKIRKLDTYDIQFLSMNLNVNLTHNEISSVNLSNMMLKIKDKEEKHTSPQSVTLDLGHNPIVCDCKLNVLLQYLTCNMFKIKADNLICKGPENMIGTSVSSLQFSKLPCSQKQFGQ